MDTNLVADIARQMLGQIPREPSIAWTLATAIICGAGAFLGTYLRTKAGNLATKEDIAAITREQDKVHHEFQMLREQFTQKHQLKMAAIEKRLAVHQEAYIQWRELLRSCHSKENASKVAACEDWWWHNSLYLSAEVSKAFLTAVAAAYSHPDYLEDVRFSHGEDRKKAREQAQKNFEVVGQAGDVIRDAVELPRIGLDKAELKPQKEGAAPVG